MQELHNTFVLTGDRKVDVRLEMLAMNEEDSFIDSFLSYTGIKTAWLFEEDDMLSAACECAYKAYSQYGRKIDRMICVTQTFEPRTPGMAFMICEQLGWNMPILEINSACQGFVDAVILAGQLNGASLIVCADNLGSHVRMTSSDRSMRYLFSDCVSAAVVSGSGTRFKQSFNPEIWHKLCISSKSSEMDGEAINFAASRFVPDALGDFILNESTLALHQANAAIISRIGRRIGLQAPSCIDTYANCSSSSIPTLLTELWSGAKLAPESLVCLCGYGAGFSVSIAHCRLGQNYAAQSLGK